VEHMLDMVSYILHHFPAIELLLQQLLEEPGRDVRQKDFFKSGEGRSATLYHMFDDSFTANSHDITERVSKIGTYCSGRDATQRSFPC
jgi:hypothetical protein